jgi:hypothetical protein
LTRTVSRNDKRRGLVAKIPGVGQLADLVARVAAIRQGRVPVGLIGLLPVALFLDLVDSPLDILGGPFTMAIAFVLEAAFLMGITGQTSYSLLFAGVDLVPGLDLIPFATLTLLREIGRAWREGGFRAPVNLDGAVIDVRPVRDPPGA